MSPSAETSVAQPSPAQPLDASKLVYELTTTPRPVPDSLESGCQGPETLCTDHMLTVEWDAQTGWGVPRLQPYGPLSLMPTASVLHYATECFEGMKLYRGVDGRLRLFRPDCNARRMLMSAQRVSLPAFDPAELVKLLTAFVAVDGQRWLPAAWPGDSFMYLRPTLIGTNAQLGVCTPNRALLYVVASYLPRIDTAPGGLHLGTSPADTVRAWVGGFGYAKLGANYGPSLLATNQARARGCHQVLWLYGPEKYCTEAGASNFCVILKAKDTGRAQLVTAPLDDRLILDGVTRRSVLQLARERLADELDVVERRYTIDEVVEAATEGRLLESFAVGTAYFVTPVSLIVHGNREIKIPMGQGKGGALTLRLKQLIGDIMYGREKHEWGVEITEKQV